jgi:hypothetical protein
MMHDPRVFQDVASGLIEALRMLNNKLIDLQRDLDFANQRLDELQSQVEALEER